MKTWRVTFLLQDDGLEDWARRKTIYLTKAQARRAATPKALPPNVGVYRVDLVEVDAEEIEP